MTKIEIKEIKCVSNCGNLKAFVDVRIGDILIRGWRVVQQPNQKPWVSEPVVSWQGKDGKPAYKPLIEIPFFLKEEVKQKVLDAFEETEEAVENIPF